MLSFIQKDFNTAVEVKWFSFFRIAFATFIICLIAYLFNHRQIVFNTIPHITFNPFPAKLFLMLWFLAAGFLWLGLFTRLAAVVNYLFVLITVFGFGNSGCGSFNDDLLRIGSFILIFFPVSNTHSLDTILYSIRFGKTPTKTTSQLNYMAAIFISLALLYFASSLTKITSPMWLKGLGLWIPASMPYNKWNNLTWHLNQPSLMYFLNYLTVAWELLFLPFLFIKKLRIPIALIGVLFHVGIAIIFPFPLLCFGPLPFYLLFLAKPLKPKQHNNHIGYNPQNTLHLVFVRFILAINNTTNAVPASTNTLTYNQLTFTNNRQAVKHILNHAGLIGKGLAVFSHFRFFALLFGFMVNEVIHPLELQAEAKPSIKPIIKTQMLLVFCSTLFCVQVFYSTYHLYSKANGAVTMEGVKKYYRIRKDITDYSLKPSNLFRTFFGLNARGVFLDHSNLGTKTVFALVTVNPQTKDTTWLPFFDKAGTCQASNFNLAWSKYTFNSVCSGTIPNPAEVHKTIWFWAHKNHQNLNTLNVVVLGRTYDFPSHYQPNYLQTQQQKPWKPVATATFTETKINYNLLDSL